MSYAVSKKWLLIIMCIVLVATPLLAACDDDEDETTKTTATPTAQATSSPMPTSTPTKPVSTDPVKIGVPCAWSGPTGMAGLFVDQVLEVVNYLLEERGGVLGGRPVKFETYDTKGEIARVQAGIRKLASDSDVLAIAIGDVTTGGLNAAVIDTTDLRIPYFTQATWEDVPQYPYTVRAGTVNNLNLATRCGEYAVDNFNPDTVAFLAVNTDTSHDLIGLVKDIFEGAGAETIYEQYYPYETTDFSPYLTRIRAEEPDVLLLFIDNASATQSLYKQITGLGGWGEIKVIVPSSTPAFAANVDGAQGTYFWAYWLPGLPNPGAKKFEEAWQAVRGGTPNNIHAMLFTCIWSAVEAIDQAGADRQAIADHIRSGTFGWEAPGGQLVFGTDGEPNILGIVALIEDGNLLIAPNQ